MNLSGGNTTFGSYGEAAVSADGYLTSGYMGMGMTSDYFYKLEGDKLVLKKASYRKSSLTPPTMNLIIFH